MDFSLTPPSHDVIFRLIARSATGRKILEAFLPHYQSGRIRIGCYPAEVIERMREYLGPDQPVGAAFVTDGAQGTIYIDPTAALGIVAPFLVHEMVHSLDSSVWERASRPSLGQSGETMARAELKAFEAQHQFTQELSERLPEYKAYLSTQFARAKILHQRLSLDDIADMYGFKVS